MTRRVRSIAVPLRVLLLLAALLAQTAFAQNATRPFDHLQTGFALTGEHTRAACEGCHLNGIFKGTPRDCASCHRSGQRFSRGNVLMPVRHPPTQQGCDTCHTTKSFLGAKFSHVGIRPGTCQTCHNGSVSNGKPETHVATNASCDSCHRTAGWVPAARMNHSGVVPGSCASCHNGTRAQGKPAQHMPTGTAQSCDLCHRTFNAWRPTAWNHTQTNVTGQCASCHSGSYPPADGKPGNHVPYQAVAVTATANCDACHKGSYSTWSNGKFHANATVASGCASCHTGSYLNAAGKPSDQIHVGATSCESCHTSTASWSGAKVDHSAFTAATNCASCHDGRAATGLSSTHVPTGSTGCLACHATTSWTPTKWNHTQVTVVNQCAICHTGGYPPADGKPGNHIPYQTVAVTASANCDGCHKGSYSSWANGKFHANYSVSTGCASCHSGAYLNAVGKPNNATHATVTGNCESCHKSTTNWSSATVDHSTFNSTTNCSQCHGVSATGKPANHIPTTANCYLCHNVAPQGWTPTKWNHTQVTVVNQCASCHTGGYPPADGKPGNHIPYQTVAVTATANCDGCHRGSYTTWANGKFHAYYTVSTGCASCHSGAYLNAVGKPNNATHATVTGNCESCHKSTTNWSSATVDHSTFNSTTNCSQCHGVTATGKPATHVPTTANCYLCHNVAPQGWTPTKWNHTQVTVVNQCASCHTGGYPPADGKPANHIPYQTVAVTASANCDGCHKGSYSSWANGKFHANYAVSSGCRTCHTGAYLNATGKPSNHIPEVQLLNGASMDCNACHTSATSWGSMTMNHNGSQGSGAGWCKACHQSGTSYLGSMEKKSLTHKSATAIDCSQSGCHRPLGTKGTPYTKWD